ncbi:DUF6146 family protein [Tenacibaculum agarivorans]|uniref:DUF6146 family protein n=1 Tax=Tenacibaculum agarivorans TaxID=1908389 RepID=UPI00094B9FF2|nr:DUF6146 family protein [Tenacibaculum agarivorans]
MKNLVYYLGIGSVIVLLLANCNSTNTAVNSNNTKEEPVVIKNDSLEYEIIILDPGFNTYLLTIARPEGYFSKVYLENRNQLYVPVWNMRVSNPSRYNPNIYCNLIDYDPNIDYGYEVNFKLFNYFQFAEQKYRMRLR